MARLRGLFGRKPRLEGAQSAEAWLFESGEAAEVQEALGPDWLPQDLETWQPDGAGPPAQPMALEQAPAASHQNPVPAPQAGQETAAALPGGSLIVQGLSKSYKKRQIIKDVSLSLHRGEAVGLLGPNGAGKTTLFYMITGLIRPDAGMIMIDDYDVTSLPMYRRARLGIGYLPQEPSIFRGLTVEENIRAVLEITQPNKKKRAEELEALLEEFDIARLRKLAGHRTFRRRAPTLRNCPLARGPPFVHAARRALRRDRSDRHRRHSPARPAFEAPRHRRSHHRSQRARDADLIDRAYIVHSGGILTEGAPDEIVANADVRRFYLGESFRM